MYIPKFIYDILERLLPQLLPEDKYPGMAQGALSGLRGDNENIDVGLGFSGDKTYTINDVFEALVNRLTGFELTGAEREANTWSANQAKLGRDWQEYFYNAYQSPQAQVQQFQQAGLNPALMYGQMQSSAPVSSDGPQSVSPQGQQAGLGEVLQTFANMAMRVQEMNADIDLKSSQADKNRADADLIRKNVGAFDSRLSLELAIKSNQAENISADTKVKYALENKYLQDTEESKARQAVSEVDKLLKSADLKTRESYNKACLDLVNAERTLKIAQENLYYAQGRKTDKETEYMRIKVDNAQKEYDKMFEQIDAQVKKLTSEADLNAKEKEFFEKKFNLQVAATVNGAVQAAKFMPGTRFQGGSHGFTNYLGSMGKTAKKVGSFFDTLSF